MSRSMTMLIFVLSRYNHPLDPCRSEISQFNDFGIRIILFCTPFQNILIIYHVYNHPCWLSLQGSASPNSSAGQLPVRMSTTHETHFLEAYLTNSLNWVRVESVNHLRHFGKKCRTNSNQCLRRNDRR